MKGIYDSDYDPDEDPVSAAVQGLIEGTPSDKPKIKANGNGEHVEAGRGVLGHKPLTPAEWIGRKLAAPDNLMGELFSTTSRVQISADTGLGKSMFGLALAVAMRLGRDFLHWRCRRPARVLVVDGEMPADLLQERIKIACGWFGVDPAGIADGLFILSREDFEDMPPLDSDEGQDWLLAAVQALADPNKPASDDQEKTTLPPVDFIVFDNVMCLTTGDLREEMTWRALIPFSRLLSRRKIGQLWLHHTGHDKSRGYGSRIFAWNMDAVGNGEAITDTTADVSFKLTWEKKRRRTPDNRADFDTVAIQLADSEWTSRPDISGQTGQDGPTRLTSAGSMAVDALARALANAGERPPHHDALKGVDTAVKLSMWRQYSRQMGGYADDEKGREAARKQFDRGKDNALGTHHAKVWGEWAWLP